MSDGIIITKKSNITPEHENEREPFEYYKYKINERGNQCYVCLYEIPPMKAAYPYHYHTANTEVFYIISGAGIIKTPEGDREITAGDVIVCPPDRRGAHKVINTSENEPLCYLDCATSNSPDVIFYPDSGKVGFNITGEESRFYETGTDVDYYKGE